MWDCPYCGVIINYADGCWNCGRLMDDRAYEEAYEEACEYEEYDNDDDE